MQNTGKLYKLACLHNLITDVQYLSIVSQSEVITNSKTTEDFLVHKIYF